MNEHYTLRRMILVNLISGGSELVRTIVTSSFMKFYTDVIGITPAAYGLIFLIFSIWNGINDPIIGYWADKREFIKGRGKYRRVIRWSIPVICFSVIGLLFASPSWNQFIIICYLLVLMVIYEGGQTMLGVSFVAFTVNTFLSTNERTKMQVIATYVNMIPVFVGSAIPIWLITGTFSRMTIVWTFTGAIVFGTILIMIGLRYIKEDPTFYENMEMTHSIKEMLVLFRELIKDRVFLTFLIAFLLIQAAIGNYYSGYLYYMDNVLGVDGLKATIPDILTGVAQMSIFPLILVMVRKYGSRDTLLRGLLLALAGHVVLTFPVNYWVAAGTYIVILAGYGFLSAINNPICGLIVDHVEIKTGKRQPGMIRGILSLIFIPASSLQPLILGYLLDASGYIGGQKIQSESVVSAIRYGTGIIPAAILLVGLVVLRLLPLDRNKENNIQNKTIEKHNPNQERVQPICAS